MRGCLNRLSPVGAGGHLLFFNFALRNMDGLLLDFGVRGEVQRQAELVKHVLVHGRQRQH